MKTLKILVILLIGGLAISFFLGMLDHREHKKLFAERPVPNKEKINKKIEREISTTKGYDIGDAATDFSLKNTDGSTTSLKDFEDAKGFIIIFTCNHCPYSVAYEDRIIALDQKYKNVGYPVIAINPNNPKEYPADSFKAMKERAKEKGFTFPYLFDAGQQIYPQYGATKTPHVFLLQKEGKDPIVKYIGAIDDNYQDANAVKNAYLENALQALLSGERIKVTTSTAIGCRIK
ncbi:thioredoxin family protein [Nonlabens sp. Ci31]|jgi:peroxiredoxin|uniref:thioredoxin family protein n=1 Tax=Nonlabens sp. Ci31 TaxID=2608253 RepID=UPI001464619F|nr:thioredoxin family protein [Nonlabens sp. Ci31]QJP34562.1 thioredoxin family protein [Nonlabens sp. Ci31]